ncbi:MAG TPA: NUDIX hydrolase [Alphaproteobacteria bacterium]
MNETVVAAAVVIKDKNVLVLQRVHKEPGLDWCFPGGRVEEGEDVHAAAIREIMEETGVVIKPLQILGEKYHPTNDTLRIVYVLCDYVSGEACVMSAAEGENVAWVPVDDNLKTLVGRDYMPFIHDYFVDHLRSA